MIQSSAHRLAIPAKFDGEPEEKLNNRHQADAKAKFTESVNLGKEVQPSYFW